MSVVIRVWSALAFMVIVLIMGDGALAATSTVNFTARITITSQCKVTATTLDFGSNGVLDAEIDQTSTITVTCTNTTPYAIQLDAGTTTGGTTSTRKMTGGGATVDYRMYSDSARTTNWGGLGESKADTGNGSGQTHTVYGRVPTQATPAPGLYEDTVKVTIVY